MAIPNFLGPLQTLTSTLAAAPPTGGAASASNSLSSFSMQTQLQQEWCWAAVSASVAIFFGSTTWTQCKVAAAELSPLDCCGQDASSGCNQAWYLDRALTRVGHFGRLDSSSSPFSDVQAEINGGRPLGCRIQWNGNSGAHFVALGGWSTAADGTEYVDVYDPYYGLVQKTYNDFVSSYRNAGDDWTHSYFTLATPGIASAGAAPIANSPLSA